MAIAVEVTAEGPPEQYFEGLKKLGGTSGGRHPGAGCLFHWMTETEGGGWRVIDVWETKEQAEEFIQGKVGPVMQELGASPPQVKFVDVASYMTAGE